MVVNMPGSVVGNGMRIGIISDTHGLIRPEAIAALRGSDLIVHAGDIGRLGAGPERGLQLLRLWSLVTSFVHGLE